LPAAIPRRAADHDNFYADHAALPGSTDSIEGGPQALFCNLTRTIWNTSRKARRMSEGQDQEFLDGIGQESEGQGARSAPPEPLDWWYVGQYGELGPLTLSQMRGLTEDRVIDSQTYVWREGMADWVPASAMPELKIRPSGPPPAPTAAPGLPSAQGMAGLSGFGASPKLAAVSGWEASLPKSDKSRLVAGLLNILPGIGRFYLGYSAHGLLQFFTGWCLGIGFIWSFVDGLYILLGGLKFDGFGRRLED
jgi:TM2 domain-containing membrane protein YozV